MKMIATRVFVPALSVVAILVLPVMLAVTPLQVANGFPQPRVVPTAWMLDFSFDQPTMIAVPDLQGNLRWYWYMTYRVVNNTGAEQLLIPEFSISTDQGDIVEAGEGVPSNVFDAIKAHGGQALLENPSRMIGKILLGEDHARESVAIWSAFEGDVDQISVFVAGLSGETEIEANPITGEDVVMRRTLMLDFATPGTTRPSRTPLITLQARRWVMR